MVDQENNLDLDEQATHWKHIPHMTALGAEIVDFGETAVTVRLPYNEELIGNPETGVLAGGVISTLLDNACGTAIIALSRKTDVFATLDLRIDYMKPATPGKDVLAFAECYKMTRRIAFVRGIAYHDSKDDPIAHAAATFMFTGRGKLNMPVPGAGT